MTRCPPAPLVLSIRSLRKERAQGEGLAYCLEVPRLELRSGEKLLITGPSGCGKSTLLDMIGMVLRPDTVDECLFFPEARTAESAARAPVWDVAAAWAGNEVERLAFWRRHVGYVLQTGGLLPFINVRENILTARRLLGPSQETSLLPEKLIDSLGIRHLLRKLPAQLSVGERQRVAIARALAANPPLVLADEPTAALDPVNAAAVLSLFSQMVDELGASLILVSHAPEQMRGMGFRRLRVRLDAAETAAVGKASTSTRAVLVDDAADQ